MIRTTSPKAYIRAMWGILLICGVSYVESLLLIIAHRVRCLSRHHIGGYSARLASMHTDRAYQGDCQAAGGLVWCTPPFLSLRNFSYIGLVANFSTLTGACGLLTLGMGRLDAAAVWGREIG